MSREGPATGKNAKCLQPDSPRTPLRELHELACEFGITPAALRRRMHDDPVGPRPVVKTTWGTAAGGKKAYYRPREVRAWFAVNGPKLAPIAQQPESPKP